MASAAKPRRTKPGVCDACGAPVTEPNVFDFKRAWAFYGRDRFGTCGHRYEGGRLRSVRCYRCAEGFGPYLEAPDWGPLDVLPYYGR